jgi:hypothetical protein
MSFFSDLVTEGVIGVFQRLLTDLVAFASGTMAREHTLAIGILNSAFVVNATSALQTVGGALLAVKLAVDVTRQYILFASGDAEVNPIKAVRRTAYATAMMAGGPWIAREVFTWGASLSIMVAQTPAVPEAEPLAGVVAAFVAGAVPGAAKAFSFGIAIMLLIMLVLWLVIVFQTVVRAVELAFISAAAPVMAVGLTQQDEGVWAVWWKELVVLSLSQAVQMFFLTGFFGAIAAVVVGAVFSFHGFLLPLAWLFVAYKSPAVLRQMAYHSGVGQAMAGGVRSFATPAINRVILARLGR